MPSGYYRFPTLHAGTLVFVCEDDLWTIPTEGGIARRLTANLGEVSRPRLSPDGAWLSFVGREEGQAEIYLMPAQGGPARRLTFLGANQSITAGWRDNNTLVFASNAGQPFNALLHLYTLDLPVGEGTANGFEPHPLGVGPARAVAFGPGGALVIGRNTGDPARWKRYRGGTAGTLWIDPNGQGQFHPLVDLPGNLASPVWIGERIYFLSDHEGVGNLYSCLPNGADLHRHSDHEAFYARNATGDGQRIVYHAGAELYLYDPQSDQNCRVPVEFYSPQTQRSRKFVDPARYLNDWDLHPRGQAMVIAARGQVASFANWEGAPFHHEPPNVEASGARCRLPRWLNDGKRLIAVTDAAAAPQTSGDETAGADEAFIIFNANGGEAEPKILAGLDIGRPEAVAVNPCKDQIVFSNHRYELLWLDLETSELRRIDRGTAAPISGFDWSPDGEWVVYSVSVSLQVRALKLWHAASGEIHPLTRPVLRDVAPAFDPEGKYIYFISYRTFDPVYDNLHFDLNFPRGMRPYLITLQKDTPNPFIPQPRVDQEEEPRSEEDKNAAGPVAVQAAAITNEPPGEQSEPAAQPVKGEGEAAEPEEEKDVIPIDLEGIQDRIVAFPVPEGIYGRVLATRQGKAIYTRLPIEGSLNQSWYETYPPARATLLIYNFEEQREETLTTGISDFKLNAGANWLIYRCGPRLRVLKAGEKPNNDSERPGRKSGWLDLERVKVAVTPAAEWRQMFREAWRLQRDQFWTADMAQVDWLAVYERYRPLVERVASRGEFSDLVWEMQGELGTSHAYEMGGDYRREPDYTAGSLAADFAWDSTAGAWRIEHIVRGDLWDPKSSSPLIGPGLDIRAGDYLLSINGRRLHRELPPAAALVNQAGEMVRLVVEPGPAQGEIPAGRSRRTVSVRTLTSETQARYREWVEQNRQRVHQASGGRVGYVHVPDMGPSGYAEFHRGFLAEVDRAGLIVDVRYNGGGHVSSLILEKLARRRIGYDASRWGQVPEPYPPESVQGAIVALTNEHAGSDGDIFSYGFKMLKLGPLLGTRTWGGVVGINPRHSLVDGTITTQPEFSFWFSDVGWGMENHGVDPDIEIDNLPQDWAAGCDVQLERAITEALARLGSNPPPMPDLSARPSRALPRLPQR